MNSKDLAAYRSPGPGHCSYLINPFLVRLTHTGPFTTPPTFQPFTFSIFFYHYFTWPPVVVIRLSHSNYVSRLNSRRPSQQPVQ